MVQVTASSLSSECILLVDRQQWEAARLQQDA